MQPWLANAVAELGKQNWEPKRYPEGHPAEVAFQNWLRALPWAKTRKPESLDYELQSPNYDYRRAWESGVVPQQSQYDNGRYHWASTTPQGEWLKSPNHPTAWKELFMQKYQEDPDALGLDSLDKALEWEKVKMMSERIR